MTMKVTNKVTGVTISVDERAAGRLGPEWRAVEPPARKPAPRRRTTKTASTDDQSDDGEE